MPNSKNTALAMTLGLALALGACGEGAGRGDAAATSAPVAAHPWMSASIIAEQADAATDADKEAVANRRAHLLLGAMTLEQKMQQLTGARPEIVPELPQCFGGRHVSGIAALDIPTLGSTLEQFAKAYVAEKGWKPNWVARMAVEPLAEKLTESALTAMCMVTGLETPWMVRLPATSTASPTAVQEVLW